jgi:hypothetical protein
MRSFAPAVVIPCLVVLLVAVQPHAAGAASPWDLESALAQGLVRGGRAPARTPKATPGVYINPAYRRAIKPADKLLIMPMAFHGFPRNMKTMLEITMFAQLISTLGRLGVSLQPLRRGFQAAGFGNLDWQLAHAIHHRITRHRQPSLSKDRCLPWMVAMATQLPKFVTWTLGALRAAGVPIPRRFRPRYLLVVHADKLSFNRATNIIKYRVIAGILDVPKEQVVAAHFYDLKSRNTKFHYIQALGDLRHRIPRVFKPVFGP